MPPFFQRFYCVTLKMLSKLFIHSPVNIKNKEIYKRKRIFLYILEAENEIV